MMVVAFWVPNFSEFCSFEWAVFMGLRLTEAQTCANARKFECRRPRWAVFGFLVGLLGGPGGVWDFGTGGGAF